MTLVLFCLVLVLASANASPIEKRQARARGKPPAAALPTLEDLLEPGEYFPMSVKDPIPLILQDPVLRAAHGAELEKHIRQRAQKQNRERMRQRYYPLNPQSLMKIQTHPNGFHRSLSPTQFPFSQTRIGNAGLFLPRDRQSAKRFPKYPIFNATPIQTEKVPQRVHNSNAFQHDFNKFVAMWQAVNQQSPNTRPIKMGSSVNTNSLISAPALGRRRPSATGRLMATSTTSTASPTVDTPTSGVVAKQESSPVIVASNVTATVSSPTSAVNGNLLKRLIALLEAVVQKPTNPVPKELTTQGPGNGRHDKPAAADVNQQAQSAASGNSSMSGSDLPGRLTIANATSTTSTTVTDSQPSVSLPAALLGETALKGAVDTGAKMSYRARPQKTGRSSVRVIPGKIFNGKGMF